MSDADLSAVARSFCGPFAFCGIGVGRGGMAEFHTATAPHITADSNTFWRAASISKIITGRVAWVALQAAGMDGSEPAQDLLGFRLCTPGGTAPSIAQIASHQAGLTDAAGYAVPIGVPLGDWIAAHDIWSGAPVGQQFEYCNLGYIILAACAERAAGERFDILARRAAPETAGFNWSGVPETVHTIPTYRRAPNGSFAAQIDAPRVQPSLPTPYILGQHPAVFSPQGGLRVSLRGALQLAQSLRYFQTDPIWIPGAAQASETDDLFGAYGWGVQVLEAPDVYPRPLIGHFANAYGFCGGVWWDAATGVTFAYALNGLPFDDESDALRPQERLIFNTIAGLA